VSGGPSESEEIRPPERGGGGEVSVSVLSVRAALERYDAERSGHALGSAFVAAARAVAEVRGERARETPELAEVRRLFDELPDYERLVNLAVSETERGVEAAGARLWAWFGLTGESPRWNEAERSRARLLVACACAPLDSHVGEWLGPRLLRLAADRWAGMLIGELRQADEELWKRVLGERYESVWRRCAPRGRWRTRELADLIARDDEVAATMQRRLSRWLAEGGQIERLPSEVEAAFVHIRTPDRLA
jgi:hypothetical protein